MRRIPIVSIIPSSVAGVPSSINVSLDYTNIFHGKEWINAAGTRFPIYTYDADGSGLAPSAPVGTGILLATTFEIVENSTAKYNGRYTVFTKSTIGSPNSSEFSGGICTIRVNETMPSGAGAELSTGYITNISTYSLTVAGESSITILERQNIQNRPLELMGNQTSGWGEVIQQNLVQITQNFAGVSAPSNPFLGQLWYDTVSGNIKIYTGGTWTVANSNAFSPYRYVQSTPDTIWTITHNLNLQAPYICSIDTFVNVAGSYKPILPNDVTFQSANVTVVAFSTSYAGYAVVRP
jgi:hypothetical protein